MANAVLPSHVSVQSRVLLGSSAKGIQLSSPVRARSRRQALSLSFRRPLCVVLGQDGDDQGYPHSSESSDSRRSLLHRAAAALLWIPAAQLLQQSPAHAAAAGTASSRGSVNADTEYELFRGKAGFSFQRPTNKGWVTAFVSS